MVKSMTWHNKLTHQISMVNDRESKPQYRMSRLEGLENSKERRDLLGQKVGATISESLMLEPKMVVLLLKGSKFQLGLVMSMWKEHVKPYLFPNELALTSVGRIRVRHLEEAEEILGQC